MSRRLLEIELGGKPVLRGIHHYWNVMMDLDKRGPFTTGDVHRQTNDALLRPVQRYMAGLANHGFLAQVGTRPGSTPMLAEIPLYRIARRSQVPPPVTSKGSLTTKGGSSQCMWNILRGPQARKGITVSDLVLLASTEAVPIGLATAKSYIAALQLAGRLVVKGKAGNAHLYALKSEANTGPIAPVVMRFRAVYDPNVNSIVPSTVLAEEDVR